MRRLTILAIGLLVLSACTSGDAEGGDSTAGAGDSDECVEYCELDSACFPEDYPQDGSDFPCNAELMEFWSICEL